MAADTPGRSLGGRFTEPTDTLLERMNRSVDTDQIDRFNTQVGLSRLAHIPDLDVVRRSRLKKATLFEMDPSPEVEAVQLEFMRLAARLWAGVEPLNARPMKDREIFDFLGFD